MLWKLEDWLQVKEIFLCSIKSIHQWVHKMPNKQFKNIKNLKNLNNYDLYAYIIFKIFTIVYIIIINSFILNYSLFILIIYLFVTLFISSLPFSTFILLRHLQFIDYLIFQFILILKANFMASEVYKINIEAKLDTFLNLSSYSVTIYINYAI